MTKKTKKPVPTLSSPLTAPEALAVSDSEKTETLADGLEAQFHPVDDPSESAVTEISNTAMRA
jgi:hypothetical protein